MAATEESKAMGEVEGCVTSVEWDGEVAGGGESAAMVHADAILICSLPVPFLSSDLCQQSLRRPIASWKSSRGKRGKIIFQSLQCRLRFTGSEEDRTEPLGNFLSVAKGA